MNKSTLTIICELNKTYFYVLEKKDKEKFDFIFSFDSDCKKSLNKYLEYVETLIFDMQDVLEKYDGRKKEYADFLHRLGLLKTKNSFMAYNGDASIVYKIRMNKRDFLSIRYGIIKKFEAILNGVQKEKI